MQKLLFTLLFGSLVILHANNQKVDTKEQQWVEDLKVLVTLSNGRVNALKGTDKNNNGVRDDVEKYVLSKYSNDPFQRDLFFKAAKTIQEIIALPVNGVIDEHIRLDRELLEIYTCRDYILYRYEDQNIEKELLNKTLFKGKVLNTPERLQAYIEHKKVLPFDFNELNEQELSADKNSCLTRYHSYKDGKQQQTSLVKEMHSN
ncbi:MAG: hypothetical protein K0U47_04380 [Epsilonproteobacteria bacterium]|nr:hypothetical protein [Campylobacterota bacterium]